MPSSSLLNNVLASLNSLRRRPSLRESIRSFSSSSTSASLKSRNKGKQSSSYYPYAVYEQKMFPIILRNPEATRKLLEAILESPNGKRALGRLARTCRALSEPALNILWRELDSLVPVLGLFPGNLLKKARRPGLGLVRTPVEDDWNTVLKYSERIRRISYDESINNVAASVFQIFNESRPRTYILSRLRELHWKAETAAGLDRCALFLNPELRVLRLEIGAKFPQLVSFLTDMSSRIKLTSFTFISPTNLPDAFTELLLRQNALQKVVLVAPGALSSGVGRWVASLPHLKSLQLDLTGRSMIAVEGFFDELRPRSGDSTPTSVGSTDSGVFSGEELDFSEIRKSALRLTGDLRSKGSFAQLRKLHLTGDVSNIAVFVKHLTSPLAHLELVIEDPPDKADWQDLSALICEKFSHSLQSLRISATGNSRFVDLVRSTSRAEPPSARLSLESLTSLPNLLRLDIDLPESVVFTPSDIVSLALACPRLELLKLCPLARFPAAAPKITLGSLAPLMSGCPQLQTIAIVVNAKAEDGEILASREASSKSLLRLHVGYSMIDDPLQTAILLSHLAPRLETLKWFQERSRPGYVEPNALTWQKVSDSLPHLQGVRMRERAFASVVAEPPRSLTADKSIDATTITMNRGVHATPATSNTSVQVSPNLVSRFVEARPILFSKSVEATPSTAQAGVDATTTLVNEAVDASPLTVSTAVDATVTSVSKSVEALFSPITFKKSPVRHLYSTLFMFPSVLGFVSWFYNVFVHYPLSLTSRILSFAFARLQWGSGGLLDAANPDTVDSSFSGPATDPDILLHSLQVRQ